jgi:hypothetical protein
MKWQGTDSSREDIKYLMPPTSIPDGDAARLQLEEMNTQVNDHLTIYATSVTNIRSWTEAAGSNAHNSEGRKYQAAADNERVVMKDKHRKVFRNMPNGALICINSVKPC